MDRRAEARRDDQFGLDLRGVDFDVSFGPDPAHPIAQFKHTNAISGDVVLPDATPFATGTQFATYDMALFRLDRRVPFAVAPPMHLALDGNRDVADTVCGADGAPFVGTIVGFGKTGG